MGIADVHWSDGNEWLLSCSLDGTLRLWDAESSLCLRVFQDPDKSSLNCCAFLPSNNNLVVVMSSYIYTYYTWIQRQLTEIDYLHFWQAGNKRGMVEVLNISTGIFPLNGSSQVGAPVTCLTFDGVGRLLWAGDDRVSEFPAL